MNPFVREVVRYEADEVMSRVWGNLLNLPVAFLGLAAFFAFQLHPSRDSRAVIMLIEGVGGVVAAALALVLSALWVKSSRRMRFDPFLPKFMMGVSVVAIVAWLIGFVVLLTR